MMINFEKIKGWIRKMIQPRDPIPYVDYIPKTHLAPEEKGDAPSMFPDVDGA